MLEEVRSLWEKSDESWSASEGLSAQFDWKNYRRITDDGNEGYLYEPPQDLKEQAQESREESELIAQAISTPMECRSLLDGKETTDEETLDELWTRVQELKNEQPIRENDPVLSLDDIQCGVAAVMICKGEEWIRDHPDREDWAKNTILSTEENTELQNHSRYGAPTDWEHRSFIAETLPVLWSRNTSNSRVRNVVARFTVEAHSQVVKSMVASAKSVRGQLGEDYVRLLRVIQRRARWIEELRRVKRESRGSITGQIDEETQAEVETRFEELSEELETLRQKFVDQKLEPDLLRIRDLLPPVESRKQNSSYSGRSYPARNLDDGLLVAAYSGLPVDSGNGATDEREWTQDWLHAIEDTVRPLALPEDESSEDIGAPTPSWDRFAMENAASLVLTADSPSQAEEFWKPILNLGPTASNWVFRFLKSWTYYGLVQTDQEQVVDTWCDMISYGLDHPRWNFQRDRVRFDREKIWRALFGFKYLEPEIWSSDLCSFAQTLQPYLQSWAESHLRSSRNARKFATFLKMPAAEPVIMDGIIWIADAAESEGERFWEDDTDDRVASLLVHSWEEAEDRLRSKAEAFSAFNKLLAKLTSRRMPVALELADRISGG
jgi:hypothetical protein